MSAVLSYPGVYIQELTSPVHTITGVATSITAFVGYTARGIDNRAQRILSFADFERAYGGLAPDSELSYAVSQFYDNGGSQAYVVRVPKNDAVAATLNLHAAVTAGAKLALKLTALSKGAWANRVVIDVDYGGVSDTSSFNLTITDRTTQAQELFSNLSADSASANYCVKVLNDPDNGSSMVQAVVGPDDVNSRPAQTGTAGAKITLPLTLDASKDFAVKVMVKLLPSLKDGVDAVIVAAGETAPTSMLGLARLVERKINAALQTVEPGAAMRCVVNANGDGLRLYADFDPTQVPGAGFDAVLDFAAPTSGSSLLSKLGLSGADCNVGHFWLGMGKKSAAQSQAAAAVAGVDGVKLPQTDDLIGDEAAFTGLYALDRVDLFNLLCIPDATRSLPGNPNAPDTTVDPNAIYAKALTFCQRRRAFLLVDPPPNIGDLESAVGWKSSGLTVHDANAAAYFPRLRLPDALAKYKLRTYAPCGVMAGVMARIDATRGVWKAPAGVEATLTGVQGQAYGLTDLENGVINQLGLNALRNFPVYGNVSWGSRTLVGSDDEGSEWKYVPVRRTALYIEESLFRGTKWVVFEPNDESLWAQIRLNVGSFMHDLFRQGAFQGKTPTDAYVVKCDSQTTTQTDIDHGIVNIYVAFAPLKPAEFVVIQIQQLAGQIQT